MDALIETIDACQIRFDMLLNVAGVDYEGGFLERGRKDIVRIVSLNNEATLRITHAVLSRRREGRPFSLVFVSSLASMYPMPLKATYAAPSASFWIFPSHSGGSSGARTYGYSRSARAGWSQRRRPCAGSPRRVSGAM